MSYYKLKVGESGFAEPQKNGLYINETYDTVHYCKRCGIGLTQNNSFSLSNIPKNKGLVIFSLTDVQDELFANKNLIKLFEEKEITGFKKYVVKNKKGKIADDVFQLRITSIVDTIEQNKTYQFQKCGDERTKLPGMKDIYPCGRTKYSSQIRNMNPMQGKGKLLDMNKSAEWFGTGNIAFKQIIVSERLKVLFEQEQIENCVFIPI